MSAIFLLLKTLLISTGVVALAELGDKTQLLAFVLAARFKRPRPIVAGIIVATIVNHGLAGALGSWISHAVPAQALRWILGGSFMAMAAWTLIPDRIDEGEAHVAPRLGVFGATVLSFFLAEMGDKTQFATIALAARLGHPLWVVAGTTLGILIADVPAVFIGSRFAQQLPLHWIRVAAASIYVVLGGLTLWFGVTTSK